MDRDKLLSTNGNNVHTENVHTENVHTENVHTVRRYSTRRRIASVQHGFSFSIHALDTSRATEAKPVSCEKYWRPSCIPHIQAVVISYHAEDTDTLPY